MLKRILTGATAIAFSQGINIVSNLILVPLFLKSLSAPLYGEWLALNAVVSYLAASDFGMNSAAGNALLSAYTRNDTAGFRRIQASALAFYLGLAGCVSIALALALFLIPANTALGLKSLSRSDAGWIAWLLGTRLLVQMPVGQFTSVFRSTGSLAVTQWLNNIQAIAGLALTVAGLWLHLSLVEISALFFLAPLFTLVVTWILIARSPQIPGPTLAPAEWQTIKGLMGPSAWFGVISLSMAVALQGPIIIVSLTLGSVAVAVTATTRTVTNMVRQVLGAMLNATWPELTRMNAAGAIASLRIGYRIGSLLCVSLAAAVTAVLWFSGGSMMALWTRGRLQTDVSLLRWFLLATLCQSVWTSASMLSVSVSRHGNSALFQGMAALASVVLTYALVGRLGILAVPIASIAAEGLLCCPFIVRDACRTVAEPYKRFSANLGMSVVACFLMALCAASAVNAVFASNIRAALSVGVVAATIASLATVWNVGLRTEDRTLCRVYLSRLYPRIPAGAQVES